jgi:hypothetical protein
MTYYTKYLKYKNKYLDLKYYSGNMVGGNSLDGNSLDGIYSIEDRLLYDPHSPQFLNDIRFDIIRTNPTTLCIKNSSGLLASILSLIKTIRDDNIRLTKIYLEKFSSFTSGQDKPSEDSLKFLQMSILSSILTYDSIKSIELVDIIFDYKDKFSTTDTDLDTKKKAAAKNNITKLIIKNSIISYPQIEELINACVKLEEVTISGCKYVDDKFKGDMSKEDMTNNYILFTSDDFKKSEYIKRMEKLKNLRTTVTITIE